jgi:DNA invertase Pin-like site-specific DNA recombinase
MPRRISDAVLHHALQPPTQRERSVRAQVRATPGATVYGYVRVSTEEQSRSGLSLEAQRQQLEDWAAKQGRQLVLVSEPGVSAKDPLRERPQGALLWAKLRKGDVLIATRLDRVFRNVADCSSLAEELRAKGVALHLLDINNGENLTTGNGASIFFMHIMAAVAQLERTLISERQKTAKAEQKQQGKLVGTAPYGWRATGRVGDKGRLLVEEPHEQAVIVTMKKLRAEGLSLRAIRDELAKAGVKVSHVLIANALRNGDVI